jgi:hypothetical protein
MDLTAQDRILMPENEQFGVLGHLTAEQDRHGTGGHGALTAGARRSWWADS